MNVISENQGQIQMLNQNNNEVIADGGGVMNPAAPSDSLNKPKIDKSGGMPTNRINQPQGTGVMNR